MSGRFALIIGNTEYVDSGLMQLTAPGKDAEDLGRVLRDKELCGFDEVNILLNQLSSTAIEEIDAFFDLKKPDDLLVLYFSGHGVRDELGSLYLAFKNTIRSRLRSTAVKAEYIRDAMDQSRSKRQIVILDCCNSGAFPQGTKAEVGGIMGMVTALQGYGRFVLTASDATQFAWEGDKVIGETDNSLFTHFLVKGLEGEADSDGDGTITVDELYDYAYEQISKITPKQTPTKSASKQEGEIVLRQITRIEDIKPVSLTDQLISEIENPYPEIRLRAIQQLAKLLNGKNLGLARSAREALERMEREDDSRRVSQAATLAMESFRQLEQKAETERKAREEMERLVLLKAEEERLAREKAEAEQKAKEEAERLALAKAEREAAEREAMRLKAEREAAEQAAREVALRAATEKAEKENAEREAAQKAEREAIELANRKKAEREAAERAELEALELAERRKAEREAKEEERISQVKSEVELIAKEEADRLAKKKIEKESKSQSEPGSEYKKLQEAKRSVAQKAAHEKGNGGWVVLGLIIVGIFIMYQVINLLNNKGPNQGGSQIDYEATYAAELTAMAPATHIAETANAYQAALDQASTATAEYKATEEAKSAYETFDNNTRGWIKTWDNTSWKGTSPIENGTFNIQVTQVLQGFSQRIVFPGYHPINFDLSVDGLSDKYYGIDNEELDKFCYGIYFRYYSTNNSHYTFFLCDQQYRVSYFDGSSWSDLIPLTDSQVINKSNWNTLRVIVSGSYFDLYINNVNVDYFSDSRNSSGGSGLWFQTRGKWYESGNPTGQILFDNFIIKNME